MCAVLFDFNGTLYFDTDINRIAWRDTVAEMSGGRIDFDSIYDQYKSVRNYLFVEKLLEMLGAPRSEEDIMYWSRRKETSYYQEYCRRLGRDQLSPGAAELLDELKAEGVKINLCTASLIENVDFYFSYLGLGRWFDKDRIAYDDGTFADKMKMYLACAERIGEDIADCIVVEDSPNSMMQAIKAGCRSIVAIKGNEIPDLPQIRQRVNDLSEFDRDLLKENVSRETSGGTKC